MVVAASIICFENEHQQSVKDFWPSILENASAVRRRYPLNALSAAFLGKTSCNNIATVSYK